MKGGKKKRLLYSLNSAGKKQIDKTTHLQIYATLQEKRMTPRMEPKVQKAEH